MQSGVMSEELKASCWKILNGKTTLPEAMRLLGCQEETISAIMSDIKSVADGTGKYYAYALTMSRKAYKTLVSLKEIDENKIFNLASHSVEDDKNQKFDIGICGNRTYRWSGKEWELMY